MRNPADWGASGSPRPRGTDELLSAENNPPRESLQAGCRDFGLVPVIDVNLTVVRGIRLLSPLALIVALVTERATVGRRRASRHRGGSYALDS